MIKTPLSDPVLCEVCLFMTTFVHDHKPDNSGLDDGPLINLPRKKAAPKAPEVVAEIRKRAWKTRREKWGKYGHR